jgi:hypothetical protein
MEGGGHECFRCGLYDKFGSWNRDRGIDPLGLQRNSGGFLISSPGTPGEDEDGGLLSLRQTDSPPPLPSPGVPGEGIGCETRRTFAMLLPIASIRNYALSPYHDPFLGTQCRVAIHPHPPICRYTKVPYPSNLICTVRPDVQLPRIRLHRNHPADQRSRILALQVIPVFRGKDFIGGGGVSEDELLTAG